MLGQNRLGQSFTKIAETWHGWNLSGKNTSFPSTSLHCFTAPNNTNSIQKKLIELVGTKTVLCLRSRNADIIITATEVCKLWYVVLRLRAFTWCNPRKQLLTRLLQEMWVTFQNKCIKCDVQTDRQMHRQRENKKWSLFASCLCSS